MWRADSLERPWCWERLRAGGEGNDRGWDGWMASPTQWTWIWVNSRSWWKTGRPGMLQFIRSQRVRHNWATELNCTERWHCYSTIILKWCIISPVVTTIYQCFWSPPKYMQISDEVWNVLDSMSKILRAQLPSGITKTQSLLITQIRSI